MDCLTYDVRPCRKAAPPERIREDHDLGLADGSETFLNTSPFCASDPDWDRIIAERIALESAHNLSLLVAWHVHVPLR